MLIEIVIGAFDFPIAQAAIKEMLQRICLHLPFLVFLVSEWATAGEGASHTFAKFKSNQVKIKKAIILPTNSLGGE